MFVGEGSFRTSSSGFESSDESVMLISSDVFRKTMFVCDLSSLKDKPTLNSYHISSVFSSRAISSLFLVIYENISLLKKKKLVFRDLCNELIECVFDALKRIFQINKKTDELFNEWIEKKLSNDLFFDKFKNWKNIYYHTNHVKSPLTEQMIIEFCLYRCVFDKFVLELERMDKPSEKKDA
jgi:hypothetical protein